MEVMTSTYELMVVYSPSLDDSQQRKAFESLEKMVQVRGGKVLSVDAWGKRRLAYLIKKQNEGIYGLLVVELSPEGPAAIDADLRMNEEVLRYLLVKIKNKELAIEKKEKVVEKTVEKKKPKKVTKKVVKKVSKKK